MSIFCKYCYGEKLVLKTKNNKIACNRWTAKRFITAVFIGFVFLWTAVATTEGQRLVPDNERKIIVLDPGHGGNDWGVKGHEGTYEKDVALIIAQKIAIQLGQKYKIILTRSGDYGLDAFNRTSIANHYKAIVFLSIHTGGDFQYKTNEISIFTYQKTFESPLAVPQDSLEDPSSRSIQNTWDRVQIPHNAMSKQLAQSIHNRLCSSQNTLACKIQQAPLLILTGADMPAVLLELGYLTNPQYEKTINNDKQLSDIATHISDGIEDFLSAYDLLPSQ